MNVQDFNFLTGNKADQIAFQHEGNLNLAGSTSNGVMVDIPTDITEALFPSSMLVSLDNVTWYPAENPPQAISSGNRINMITPGLASQPGNMKVIIRGSAAYMGVVYYRITGTYNG